MSITWRATKFSPFCVRSTAQAMQKADFQTSLGSDSIHVTTISENKGNDAFAYLFSALQAGQIRNSAFSEAKSNLLQCSDTKRKKNFEDINRQICLVCIFVLRPSRCPEGLETKCRSRPLPSNLSFFHNFTWYSAVQWQVSEGCLSSRFLQIVIFRFKIFHMEYFLHLIM